MTRATAQVPLPPYVPPVPNLNPSSSIVVPQPPPVPVSPGVGGGGLATTHFYHSGCSVFRHGPCFPHYLPPIGQDLRLTIVSTDENTAADQAGGAADDQPLNSIREMFTALRACWLPPPKDEAHHGMEYTIRFALKRDGTMIAVPRRTYSSHDIPDGTRDVYRDAIDAALKRCIPLHFSAGMGEPSPAVQSPFDLWTIAPSTNIRIRLDNFGDRLCRASKFIKSSRTQCEIKTWMAGPSPAMTRAWLSPNTNRRPALSRRAASFSTPRLPARRGRHRR